MLILRCWVSHYIRGGTSESALTGKRRNMDMKSQKTNVQDWVFSVSAVFLNMEVQS